MKRFLISILILVLLMGCEMRKKGTVIAQVGSNQLTLEELKNQIPKEYNSIYSQQALKELVDDWVTAEILAQEAEKNQLDRVEKIEFRIEESRRQILMNEYLERYVFSKIQINEEDLKNYYINNKNNFKYDDTEVRISVIQSSNYNEVVAAWKEITAGKDFAEKARQISNHPSAENGGDLGFLRIEELDDTFKKLIEKLKIGELSRAKWIDNKNTILIKLTDAHNRGDVRSFNEVRDQIFAILYKEKEREMLNTALSVLEKQYEINKNYSKLANIFK